MLFGEGGEVRQRLAHLNDQAEQETYRRLLPGYVRRFVEKAAPLLDLRIEGDLGDLFTLVPDRPAAADALLPALETYSEQARDRLTVYKPANRDDAVWMHPGEPVFDGLAAALLERFGRDGLQGAVFIDPYATEAYLFHLVRVSVEQHGRTHAGPAGPLDGRGGETAPKPLESRLIGLRQTSDGVIVSCPVEHLLLLRGARGLAPSRARLATLARGMAIDAARFAREDVSERLARVHRQRRLDALPARLAFVNRGFDFQAAELAAARSRLTETARTGATPARVLGELARIKERQRSLTDSRRRRLADLRAEPDHIRAGAVAFLVHALVMPIQDSEATEQYDADVEAIAMQVAVAHEARYGAAVEDVSRPELARRAGLTDWPGFDLRSRRPAQERAIEVKGRATSGNVEMSDNEWARACNLRDAYWLYVVFDCATPRPRLLRVRDPFGRLLARDRESVVFTITPRDVVAAAE